MNQESNNFNFQNNNSVFNNQSSQNSSYINDINNQNMYENKLQTNNIYDQTTNSNNKQNKNKIIGIIAIIIIFLFSGIMLFNNSGSKLSSNKKHTVEYGETLKIYELEGYYDFELEVLSVEKNYVINEFFHSGECLALKVKIKNNSSETLSILPYMMNFNLLDSSNNEIVSLNIAISSTMTNAIEEIPSREEKTGYLYFFHIKEDGTTTNVESNDIAKLEIEIVKDVEPQSGTPTGDYEQYYIMLK